MFVNFQDIILFFFLICFICITVFLCIALYRVILTLKLVHVAIEENRGHIKSSITSASGICKNIDSVSGKLSTKIEENADEIDSYIPAYMPYITGAISFIISIFNIFKSNKSSEKK